MNTKRGIVMASKKLTKKELEQMIQERDKSIKELVRTIGLLESKIAESKNKADDMFCNSATYRQMQKEIEYLNDVIKANKTTIEAKENTIVDKMNVIQKLTHENEQLKQDLKYAIADKERTLRLCVAEIEAIENKYKQNLQGVNKLKNERNAGRKERFTDDEKATINMLRLANNSYRAIAKQMGCSVGTIYNIIKEMDQG